MGPNVIGPRPRPARRPVATAGCKRVKCALMTFHSASHVCVCEVLDAMCAVHADLSKAPSYTLCLRRTAAAAALARFGGQCSYPRQECGAAAGDSAPHATHVYREVIHHLSPADHLDHRRNSPGN